MTEAEQDRQDALLVAAAANDGRISPDFVPQWLMAMKADRPGTRKTLASLVSPRADMLRAAGVDPDLEYDLEYAYDRIVAPLDLSRDDADRRLVNAAIAEGKIGLESRQTWLNALATNHDAAAQTIASMPATPRITRSVMASQSSRQSPVQGRSGAEIDADPAYRDVAWRLGPGFRNGLKPPEVRYFAIPEVDDDFASELIDNGDGTARWSSGAVRGD
ncbi:hypothetical protein MMAN_58050 [Mycobacterium mantenii]|uniref:Uncharacterized protein n=1 Tax=Mycobacterium mantenii TaxID=560555 RepID=A0A1X0G3W1_MYCNT|nr:hypothetical protein [Mycobacterium mantenii]MCV7243827.1 hypothetical protein [Mycobacterium mantenii]ORB08723.1 hypothetical protein BST30_01930 [Mycobacterium mantenii]BBY35889.1 hypothetical protein MMAN_00230 [Mycobacterium mantenii]BBY41671.1 hypothetical protein MMAN_58050 [Mycobacterium mantenii]